MLMFSSNLYKDIDKDFTNFIHKKFYRNLLQAIWDLYIDLNFVIDNVFIY